MKPAILTVLAALATSAIAAPTAGNGLVPAASSTPASATNAPASAPKSGGLLSDLAPGLHTTLTITGQDSKKLLVQLSPSVVQLLTGLGLPQVGVPVGQVVKQAAHVGDLLKDLGEPVENLLTVTGKDVGALLIRLSPEVKGLLAGLLPSLAEPVGEIVATLGDNIKRDEQASGKLVQDLAPGVNDILNVVGKDTKSLLIKLSPGVANLLNGLGLTGLGNTVGQIVYKASSVGDLVKHLGPSVENLLAVTGKDGGALLIQLSPEVAGLVASLGLPTIATPVGGLLHVTGDSL
ncbi:hypothetical protein PHISCL_09303 [Aspergillus sclerotialis]|uniref:Uncharacterized protein n=1 Tax=Aspergillus sclerotialis TaxID=2070753 RepID=A0A3A2ZKF3_9EURO|nr:hypothetical protein PHISCL_09303 [Aspergillus sclerotialis]